MSLYESLQTASSEEDVKDLYIKALGLKKYQKGLIDIQTKEIWFEAKAGHTHTSFEMFTQLLHYAKEWLDHGEELPPFLAVIDVGKAAIMKTIDAMPILERKDIKWGKSASDVTPEALAAVSAYIGTYMVSFNIKTHEQEFIDAVKNAIKQGEIIRTQITPSNLKQVFDRWVEMIGRELADVPEEDYALLFFADIMHDGTVSSVKDMPAELLHKDGTPVFSLGGKLYELGNKEGYRRFWAIYHKPPKEEYRNYLLERRDSLIPLDERSFKGAYYTPLHVVDAAYDKLTETLGEGWQDEYLVWDMCCGVGNLEIKHSNHRNIYMSTLDQADIDVMKATKTCVAAERFQYDYLNDDVTDDGQIDYSLTNKIPESLRRAIKSGKKILVLINPPYAEAMNADNISSTERAQNKKGVAKTRVAETMMDGYGSATRELFTQFVVRISKEIPHATLAMFSTLKYVNAPFFEAFRKKWDSEYIGGFIVPARSFDGIKGTFPIGFLVWQTSHGDGYLSQIKEIKTSVLDFEARPIGNKIFVNVPNKHMLNAWVEKPKSNKTEVIPLTNAVSPTLKHDKKRWSDGAVAYLTALGNDVQHANGTWILSSRAYGASGGYYINTHNLEEIAVLFTVRRIIKPTWQNDRDQFLQPSDELTEEFKNDCLVWMLFNSSNLTASANDLEWNEKKWSIVNHFIPFTEQQVGAPERFESDFMVRYMAEKEWSLEATEVLARGRELWSEYFKHTDPYTVREELKLNRPDVGWYQIRNTLKRRNDAGDVPPVSFTEFETAYRTLSDKIRPQVFELGFLK
ncbi:hypothetical protein H6778_01065 [Candidatus Nomurabacteria bacterium]|nr:hypothetical protein [Candidatus Nomurabacteria bacterium]